MLLLLNRCMCAASLWVGRPSWRGPAKLCVGVSDISMHTGRGNPGVDMPLGGCSWFCWYGVDIAGWRRASSSSFGHGGYGAALAGRGRLSSLSSFCPVIRTPCINVSPSCHEIPISRARRLPSASNNSCRIRGCGPVSPCEYARVSSRSSRVWLTNRDKSPNATP